MPRGGTIQPASKMDPKIDAISVYDAVKGIGCNNKALIRLFSNRSAYQRRLIADAYKAGYGETLEERLSSELSGNFKSSILNSFNDQSHVDAQAMYQAMSGLTANANILIDVMCTSNNEEIKALRRAYKEVLQKENKDAESRNLESDLMKGTSGDFQKLLVALCQGLRVEEVQLDTVQTDAEALFEAGEGKIGTDETIFIRIFATRSWNCIRDINSFYEQTHKHDLLVAIGKETSGNFQRALQMIVKTARNRTACFAEIIYDSMKGVGTRDANLIRMIIGHSETDLAVIRNHFNTTYPESLASMIKGDTSGDYRDFLLAILREE